jgi:Restriction endonuclease
LWVQLALANGNLKLKTRLTPHLIDLTFDAALRSFWRKNALASFLQGAKLSGMPAWLPEESKREYLMRAFAKLRSSDQGETCILQLAQFLTEQSTFPDLQGWEDTAEKIEMANASVTALRSYLREQEQGIISENQRLEARKRLRESQERARKSQQTLQALSDKLSELSGDLGSPEAGHEFEDWFYGLMRFCEINARPPYKIGGREIDGSITIGDTTYLVECKFTTGQSGAPDIDVFRGKVESKADNTMGIFVSISGFSSVAIKEASGRKTPLLLLDHGHLYRVLGGVSSFRDVVERIRRHSSQTGEAYLATNDFDG